MAHRQLARMTYCVVVHATTGKRAHATNTYAGACQVVLNTVTTMHVEHTLHMQVKQHHIIYA